MPSRFFNWPPFKLYAIDADTGKPLDPNVGITKYVRYYDVKADKHGKKSLVSHKGVKAAENKPADNKNDDKQANGKKDDKPSAEASKNGKPAEKQNDGQKAAATTEEWNAELDEKLKTLATGGTPWPEIATAIGKPQKACKKRFFGDLKLTLQNKDKAADAKAPEQTGDANKNTAAKANGNKTEKPKQKETSNGKGKQAASKAASNDGEARFTMNEWMTLQEDDLFSFGELQCLSELIAKDSGQSWLRIASAFYDTTGRRVHPDDIRDKFQQLGAMQEA